MSILFLLIAIYLIGVINVIRISSFVAMIIIVIVLCLPTYAQTAKIYNKGNVLVGANFNDGTGSSDMTLVMQLSGDGKVFVDEGHPVKYLYNPDNCGIKGWTKVDFDDRNWKDGLSGVGFSDNDDNTTTPAGLLSIWTRYNKFDIPNASNIKELILLVDYDDAYIAWLNGVEIARSASVTAKGLKVGDEPPCDFSQGGITNRGSCELPAGKPNANRWKCASIESVKVKFEFGGTSAMAVNYLGKLASVWGGIKSD